MAKSDMRDWGWVYRGGRGAYGSGLATRALAVEDALRWWRGQGETGPVEIKIGRCQHHSPCQYIPDELEPLLERMADAVTDDAIASGSDGFWDEEVFVARDPMAAQTDLTAMLVRWAKKHVPTSPCWILVEAATETIGGET